MPKGYVVTRVDILDPDAYAKYGARFLVRSGRSAQKEGALRGCHLVIEFNDYATAMACYESPEYQRALAIRRRVSRGDLVIIEGYDGIQPA